MPKNKTYYSLLFGALLLAPFLFAGSVHAINLISEEEARQKQEQAPIVPKGERPVDLVGIFPPGFTKDIAVVREAYEKEYGPNGYITLDYKGYTLIAPPFSNGEDGLGIAKKEVDQQLLAQQSSLPSNDVLEAQIGEIYRVFGTPTSDIAFNPFLGAYTDSKGFQYNFKKSLLVSKHVGVNNALTERFQNAYPYLKPGSSSSHQENGKKDQSIDAATSIVQKILGKQATDELGEPKTTYLGGDRLGLEYGNSKARVMVDQKTGDIIYFYVER